MFRGVESLIFGRIRWPPGEILSPVSEKRPWPSHSCYIKKPNACW